MNDAASNETLMLLYREGEAQAFDALFARHAAPSYRYLSRLAGPAGEELFNDVWMRLIEARAEYQPRLGFLRFFYRLAHQRLDAHRQRTEHILGLDESCFDAVPAVAGGESAGAATGRAAHVLTLIEGLSDEQREVFLLRDEGGLSIEDIGDVLEIDRDSVHDRLRGAIRRLRAGLANASAASEGNAKVVSLLDLTDPVISSLYHEAARETPLPEAADRILEAAHAAVEIAEPVVESRAGGGVSSARVAVVAAGIAAVLGAGAFGLKWLAQGWPAPHEEATTADPHAVPVATEDWTRTGWTEGDTELDQIATLWQAGRVTEAHAAFEAFLEAYPNHQPRDEHAALYRELQYTR